MNTKEKLLAFLIRNKKAWAITLLCAGTIVLLFGCVKLLSFTLPMLEHNYGDAISGRRMGDVSIAYYDGGLSTYKQGDYASALKILTAGYTTLSDADGNIPPRRQRLAADYQLLIGNCLFYQQKLKAAAEAYKQALRHDPNDLSAKYNLELIAQIVASGGGQGDPKGPAGQAGKGRDKGI